MEYATGVQLLTASNSETPLKTGSPELDDLTGGIRKGMFYLFYGKKQLIEPLFQHLTTQALRPSEKGSPKICYILCGNYRKERTNLAIEELAQLIEDSGFHMWEALRRIQIFTASSADQQALLVDKLREFLEGEENVSLVIVQGIFKLHKDDARQRNKHVVWEEIQRSITGLWQTCAERGIPVVASGREMRVRGEVQPQPESSSFLRHLSNVIVYLRRRQKGSKYNRAFLIDHPAKPPGSVEYHFEVDETVGRETRPVRQSFQDLVERLRRELKEPMKSVKRKTAFEHLVETWASELGAITYAESFKLLDLMLLISDTELRSLLEDLRSNLQLNEAKIKRIEDRLS